MIWLITVSFNDLFSCKHPTPKCMYCTLVLLYAMARLVCSSGCTGTKQFEVVHTDVAQ